MRAGELDRLIVIETPTEGQDDYSARTLTWATFATVWAKVSPVRGRETVAADRALAQADTVFRVYWLSGVTTKMRVSYDGQYYDIQHVAEIGRREGLDILARLILA